MVLKDEKTLYDWKNVFLLRKNGEFSSELISDMLLEHSVCKEINPDKNRDENLLWNLYVFENEKKNGHLEYDFLLNCHHTIGQGTTSFSCLVLLVEIFEKLYRKQSLTEFRQFEIFPGVEKLFKGDIEKLDPVGLSFPKLDIPSFMSPKRARQTQLEQSAPKYIDPNSRLVFADTNSQFVSLSDLCELSRNNYIKIKSFKIDPEKMMALLNKCRSNGTKLNGCLELISSLSLIQLFAKYKSLEELKRVIYYNVLSLRRFRNNSLSEETLGFCGGALYCEHNTTELVDLIDSSSESSFWKASQQTSRDFHRRIESGEWKQCLRLTGLGATSQLIGHYLLSNTGIIRQPETLRYFKLIDSTGVTYGEVDNNLRMYANYFLTNPNGSAKWVIHYNSFFIDTFLIDDLIQFSSDLINKITKI